MERGFAVIGLGYVGLPVALALAKKFERVVGFDISQQRIAALRDAKDTTGEVTEAALRETRLGFTHDQHALNEASFFIVTVPTPIDAECARSVAARSCLRPDRPPFEGGHRRGFRIHRLSWPDPRILRAASRRGLGPEARG